MLTPVVRCTAAALLITMLAVNGAACDTSYSTSNPGPLLPTPLVAEVGGMWNGSTTLSKVAEGECVGAMLLPSLGRVSANAIAIEQTGTDLAAKLTSADTGLACAYRGTISLNNVVLESSSCSANPVNQVVQCPNGSVRQLELIGSSITAAVAGGIMTGTVADTFNVRDADDKPVAGLVVNQSLTTTRR